MRYFTIFVLSAVARLAVAQTAGSASAPHGFDQHPESQLVQRAQQMLKEAQGNGSGVASVTLERYSGHSTMLTVRTRSGGAESHQHFNDVFVVLEGEGTEITGGSMVDAHEVSPGEMRGTRVNGGETHQLGKGDIVHISPGVPHQLLVTPGTTFIYYVIKIEQK